MVTGVCDKLASSGASADAASPRTANIEAKYSRRGFRRHSRAAAAPGVKDEGLWSRHRTGKNHAAAKLTLRRLVNIVDMSRQT
jgi:hypothetical protein